MTNSNVTNGVVLNTATGNHTEDANFTFNPVTQTLTVPATNIPAAKTLTIGAAATGTQAMSDLLETITSANGAAVITGWNEELLVLATGAATTDTTGNLLPANSIILAVNTRVTTAITTAATFSVGDPTTAARFTASQAGIAANSTTVGLAHMSGAVTTAATGPTQASAAKVRITCNANPAAGAVRITVFYQQFVAPTA